MGGRRKRRMRALVRALQPFADIPIPPRRHGDFPLIVASPIRGGKIERTIRTHHVRAARRALRKARKS